DYRRRELPCLTSHCLISQSQLISIHFFPETHTLIALINFTVFNWQRRQKIQANLILITHRHLVTFKRLNGRIGGGPIR
ncbi:MAG: hypothetical protein OIF58_15470, partial [Cohaesibacter sp.]|nr:hypothetical protein [Cohaesibacter sp.]